MKKKHIKIVDGKELVIYGFNLKKNGKNRLIYKTSGEAHLLYKNMASEIYDYYQFILSDDTAYNEKIDRSKRLFNSKNIELRKEVAKIPHAFFKGRGAVTNASEHVDFDLTIKLDIKDFFGSITQDMLEKSLSEVGLDICFIDNKLPQGLATSPTISNIAMISIDEDIYILLSDNFTRNTNENSLINSTHSVNNQKKLFAYTRYADDITISIKLDDNISGRDIAKEIIQYVAEILSRYGFEINNKKTKIMFHHNGYRTITGISVNDHGIKASRKTIKLLRASMHQINLSKADGLLNWVKQIERVK